MCKVNIVHTDANILIIQKTSLFVKILRLVVTNHESILLQRLDETLLSSDRILETALELSNAFLTVHINLDKNNCYCYNIFFVLFPGTIILYVRNGMVLVST